MRRFLSILILMGLRALIVCSITLWGLSNVATLGFRLQAGTTAWELTLFKNGPAVTRTPGDLVPTGAYMLTRHSTWNIDPKQFSGVTHKSTLGIHWWKRNDSLIRLGISWPAFLAVFIVSYSAVHFRLKRRRIPDLETRLKNARSQHSESINRPD